MKIRKEGRKEKKKNLVCERCKTPLKGKQRKFCTDRCRTRYYSLKTYNKNKDNPKYKKAKKEYHKKWREKNRERFNEMMRKPSRVYQMKNKLKISLKRKQRTQESKRGNKNKQ